LRSVVKVTRRGQTTIPADIRKKLRIREGDQLWVETVERGVLFKPIPRLEEMAGVDAKYDNAENVKKRIDKLREEY